MKRPQTPSERLWTRRAICEKLMGVLISNEKAARLAGAGLLLFCLALLIQAMGFRMLQKRDALECRTRSGQLLRLRYVPSIGAFRAGCEYRVFTEGNPVARSTGAYPRALCDALLESYRAQGNCVSVSEKSAP